MHNAFSYSFFSFLLQIRIPKAEYLYLGLRIKGSCLYFQHIGSLGAVINASVLQRLFIPSECFCFANSTLLSLPFGKVEKQREKGEDGLQNLIFYFKTRLTATFLAE